MGFFDDLKNAVSGAVDTVSRGVQDVGRQVIDTGNQIVDGAKQAAGAVAGAVVGATGQVIGVGGQVIKVATGGFAVDDPEQAAEAYRRSATRAVLAEAALQTVAKLDPSNPQHKKFIDNVEKYYNQSQGAEKQLAQAATPAVQQLQTPTAVVNATAAAVTSYPSLPDPSDSGVSVDAKQQQFADTLVAAAQKEAEGDADFIKFFTDLVGNAVQIQPLGSSLDSSSSFIASPFAYDPETAVPAEAEAAAKRALLGDAALQAAIEDESGDIAGFGFFNNIVNIVKTVAPVVIKNAPDALGAVGRVFGGN